MHLVKFVFSLMFVKTRTKMSSSLTLSFHWICFPFYFFVFHLFYFYSLYFYFIAIILCRFRIMQLLIPIFFILILLLFLFLFERLKCTNLTRNFPLGFPLGAVQIPNWNVTSHFTLSFLLCVYVLLNPLGATLKLV